MPQGAVGPSQASAPQRRSDLRTHEPPPCARCNRLDDATLASSPWLLSGGVLCRPLSARLQVSQQRRGVSDPASGWPPRPRGRQAGSLTPHVSASEMCWGAGVRTSSSCVRSTSDESRFAPTIGPRSPPISVTVLQEMLGQIIRTEVCWMFRATGRSKSGAMVGRRRSRSRCVVRKWGD